MSIIPAKREAEVRVSQSEGSPGQKAREPI
jgi:hypothetical protein